MSEEGTKGRLLYLLFKQLFEGSTSLPLRGSVLNNSQRITRKRENEVLNEVRY